jgi:hypothetical protein
MSCCGWGLTHFWQTDAVLNDDKVINICKYFIWKGSQYGQAQKTQFQDQERQAMHSRSRNDAGVGTDYKLKTSPMLFKSLPETLNRHGS